MRNKVSKILLVLLLLLISAIPYAYNVYAQGDCILVSSSKVDLSPTFLTDSHNLNTSEMKRYLIKCMELSEILSKIRVEEIKEKLDYVSFFCFQNYLYDSEKRAVLNIWVPNNILRPRGTGRFYSFPMKYTEETKICTIK